MVIRTHVPETEVQSWEKKKLPIEAVRKIMKSSLVSVSASILIEYNSLTPELHRRQMRSRSQTQTARQL